MAAETTEDGKRLPHRTPTFGMGLPLPQNLLRAIKRNAVESTSSILLERFRGELEPALVDWSTQTATARAVPIPLLCNYMMKTTREYPLPQSLVGCVALYLT